MAKDYYEILGISRNAEEKEIKRAYFRLIRQFSPEHDPERFKEIREAYENLKEGKKVLSGEDDLFTLPEDPMAQRLFNYAKMYYDAKNYKKTEEVCEEAVSHFPRIPVFRFMLAVSQRRNGRTGKAVKNCEILVKEKPDCQMFVRELAIAYDARGFVKKAEKVFEDAFQMGCNDLNFMMSYVKCCDDLDRCDKAMSLLFLILGRDQRWTREEIPEIIGALGGLCYFNSRCVISQANRIVPEVLRFVKNYPVYLDSNFQMFSNLYLFLINEKCGMNTEAVKGMDEIYALLEAGARSEEAGRILGEMKQELEYIAMKQDKRLDEAFIRIWETINNEHMDYELERFAMLDFMLCVLAQMPGILTQFAILREEYPIYFESLAEFAETLERGGDFKYLKDKYLKEYSRLSLYCVGGVYFKLHPEDEFKEKEVWTGEDPYVRQGKKIGRNEQCPCGSGKKYKQCCGRNKS